jgi:hypothetical protein
MDSVAIKKSDETIGEYIGRLNDTTSIDVGAVMEFKPSTQIGWVRILFYPPITFLKIYFGQLKIFKGIKGFLDARFAAIGILAVNVKLWEYQMRKKEGKNILPPTSLEEVNQFRQKYYS